MISINNQKLKEVNGGRFFGWVKTPTYVKYNGYRTPSAALREAENQSRNNFIELQRKELAYWNSQMR